MKEIFNLNGFLGRNKLLMSIWLICVVAVFSYVPLISTILIDFFGLTEEKISFLAIIYILGFIFATYLNSYFMNNHINIIKILTWTGTVLLISLLGEAYLMSRDVFNFNIFIMLRSVDAAASYLITITISHIIATKILYNTIRTKISSLNTSVSYAIKALAPILVSSIVVFYDSPLAIYIFPIIFIILMMTLLLLNQKKVYRKYTRILMRQVGVKKRKNKDEIKHYFSKSSDGLINRIYYLVVNFLHNILRSNYDLILPAMLLLKYDLGVDKVAMLIALMVAGQSMQFKVHFLLKFLKRDQLYFIHICTHALVFIMIATAESYSIISLAIMFYLLGVSRSIYSIWYYDYGMNLINEKITIQNQKFVETLAVESGHLLSYVATMLLVLVPGSYDSINTFYLSVLILLLLLFLFRPSTDSMDSEIKRKTGDIKILIR